jgi:hypothetical protein
MLLSCKCLSSSNHRSSKTFLPREQRHSQDLHMGCRGGGLAMVQSDNNIVTYIHTYTYVSMFK